MQMSGFVYMYVCTYVYNLSDYRVQKRALHPLELDLEIVVSHMWSLGIEVGFSARETYS